MLTDKTGTLTQNEMVFKKIAMEFAYFTEETVHELKIQLNHSLQESRGPYGDTSKTGERLQTELKPLKQSRREQL